MRVTACTNTFVEFAPYLLSTTHKQWVLGLEDILTCLTPVSFQAMVRIQGTGIDAEASWV